MMRACSTAAQRWRTGICFCARIERCTASARSGDAIWRATIHLFLLFFSSFRCEARGGKKTRRETKERDESSHSCAFERNEPAGCKSLLGLVWKPENQR